jgi:hypothetical protein
MWMRESVMIAWRKKMSDKWMSADAFTDRVEEVHNKLLQRWENVHPCDVEHGFFYCCDDEDHKGHIRHMRVRVCDGCGDDLYPTGSVCEDFHCTDCEFWYSGVGGGHLKPPSMWGYDTGESFNDEGELI